MFALVFVFLSMFVTVTLYAYNKTSCLESIFISTRTGYNNVVLID